MIPGDFAPGGLFQELETLPCYVWRLPHYWRLYPNLFVDFTPVLKTGWVTHCMGVVWFDTIFQVTDTFITKHGNINNNVYQFQHFNKIYLAVEIC